jgi:uncharacterized protein DUF4190
MSDLDRSAPWWRDQAPYQPPAQTSGIAIASLVLGIIGLTAVPLISSMLATYLGYQARNEIDASDGRLGGRNLAVAGIVLGWVGFAIVMGALLVFAVLLALFGGGGR